MSAAIPVSAVFDVRAESAALGRVRLRTLVYIRWIAVVGQATTLLLVHYVLGFALPVFACLFVVAVSAGLNITLGLATPLGRRVRDRTAALYLAYDLVQLTVLLYLTGGLQNPFSILILAPVTASATVLSRGSTVGLGVLSGLCITLLALIHEPFPWRGQVFGLPDFYIMGVWQALVVGILFIAAYVGSVSEEARRLSGALAATQLALGREQRMSALGALAAAVAHELGSPLATIAVTAKELSHDAPPKGPLAEDAALILEQSDRCRDILAQLANKPVADGGEPFERVALETLCSIAAAPHASDGVAVLVNRTHDKTGGGPSDESETEPHVQRSPEILHGLGTLIQNAVQFARATVTIGCHWTATTVTITIVDDGQGFPTNLLDRLGEPYLSTRRDGPKDQHMGLGIFIAETLLGRTGARLSFGNEPGLGARVTVTWERAALERIGRGDWGE